MKQIFRKGIIGFLAAAVLILSLPGAAVFADEMQPEEPAAAAAYEAGTAGEAREDIADDNTEPGLPADQADSEEAAQPADQADSIEVPADQAGSAETAQPADETAGGDEMLSAEAETAGSGDPAPAVEAVEEKPYRSAAAVNPKAAIEDLSGTSSSFTVRVTDIPAGQTGTVYIPVWCAADQSDIHWYQAEKSGNDYILHVSISDHSYLTGIYKIHVYQKQDNGSLSFLTSTTADLSVKYSRLTAAAPASDGSVEISLKGFKAYGTVSSVSAAVWSAENDQDDIKWYDLTGKSTAYSGTINVNDHKGYGIYYVHLYYRSKSGKMVFVGSTEFNREGPSVSAINAAVSGTSFTVTVSGVTAPAGVAKVLIPIWAKSDQSDIIWYEAQKSGSDYVVTSDITKHRYTTGKYNAHVYVKDTEGNQYYLGKTAFTTELSYSTLQAEDTSGNESAYTVTLAGAGAWSSSSSLRCAVWSAADGQDDIRWYDMQGTQNSYKAAVKTADHSGTGKYYVHCYARWQNGSMSFVGNTEFTVSQEAGGTSESKGTFAKTTVSGDGMTYHVTLKGVKLSGEITKMQFAVWSQAGGQDDLIWYAASGSNGTYSVDVPIINHMTAGTYHVHVYATLKGAKQQTFVNNTDFKVASVPEDKIVIRNADTSGDEFDADVYLVRDASTVANVKVAVWCAPDQNDIIWQNAVLQSDGAYRVHVSAADHGYLFGTYNLHAYVYDASGKGTFAASASQKISGENIVVMTQISESSVVIKIIGAVVDGAAPSQIYVPTWSTEDGQDDIVWYSASGNSDGSYSVTVQRSNHSTDGEYVSHIYLYNAAGTPTLVKALSFTLSSPSDYDAYAASVMRKIMYAVETGGMVYGNARYDAFTPAYKNSSRETAITIGAGQWFAYNAQNLLKTIRSTDPATFAALDTAGIGTDLDTLNWTYYGGDGNGGRTIVAGSPKAVAIQNIISSDVGRAVQDMLMDQQTAQYVQAALDLGVTDLKARMFCANISHLGGSSAMKRVISQTVAAGRALTMENLYTTMRENRTATNVGADLYNSRHVKIMGWLNQYIG